MISANFSHSISPAKVIRGNTAWQQGKKVIPSLGQKPILLGRSKATREIREKILNELSEIKINCISCELKNDCCEDDLNTIIKLAKDKGCDSIIASGGGKVLDSGKLIAHRLSIPCITIPLSASTCAGWTALSNIYTDQGAFLEDVVLYKCPDLLIFDYEFVRAAPKRTLASGMADALAKWYEASLTSSSSTDGLVQQAVQMARVLRDQILLDGYKAFNNNQSKEWERIAECCALTAGLIGGIGGSKCRTAIAHPIHNGLTQLKFIKKPLHGELVGFGITIQLLLEQETSTNRLADQARLQLIGFLKTINLPVKINSIGLENLSIKNLRKATEFACKDNSDIHHIPFKISQKQILNALTSSMASITKTNEIIVKAKS